jgi:hypothetical protein
MRREENHVTRRVMNMWKDGEEEVDLKKDGIDCVRQDMREMAVSDEMTSDRRERRKRTCCADPK